MKKQRGITLIALIITIIVMLILVGVTINVALNGGLFTTAQSAADGTKKEAEREQLLAAMLAAVGADGEVDFAKVKLPEGFTGSNGTYTGKSGTTYTVNKKTLEMTESSGGSEDVNNPLLGTYYDIYVGAVSGTMEFELKSNNIAVFIVDGEENQGIYTYDKNTKTGKITVQYKEFDSSTGEETGTEQFEFPFNYIEITDKNNNVINTILEVSQEISETNIVTPFTKQGVTGLIPLTGYVYENGNKTIEFGTGVEDGKTYGTFAIKTDGVVLNSEEGAYACYNGKLLLGGETEFTISDDYSTITINETVYTKK